jgi:glycosyltransferase involved in cell wall biosynthesis
MTASAAPRVLQLCLDRPDTEGLGGVSLHVAALSTLCPPAVTAFTAYPSAGSLVVEEWEPRRLVALLPVPDGPAGVEATLTAAAVGTRADVLHVHAPQLGPDAIVRAAATAGARLCLTLHDHSLVCENYELLEGGSRYCGIPMDLDRCDRCLSATRGRPPGAVLELRGVMGRLVTAAEAFVAPSRSVLEHAARVHPLVRERARRVDWGVPAPAVKSELTATGSGPLRVAIVSVWAKVKGTDRLPELLAACRELDVEWHLFGATEGASLAEVRRSARRVVAHGAYRRRELAGRLVGAGCHVVLLPSVGAETFSLTLSEAVAAGLPVLASDLGAPADRVSEGGLGWLFDPFTPEDFAAKVRNLAGRRDEVDRVAAHVRRLARRSEEDMARDHTALWTELAARPPRGGGPSAEASTALSAFEEGALRAARHHPSRFVALYDQAKHSDFYRDLRLRRLLPEDTRKAVERALRRRSGGRSDEGDR